MRLLFYKVVGWGVVWCFIITIDRALSDIGGKDRMPTYETIIISILLVIYLFGVGLKDD